MKISKRSFGTTRDGRPVLCYTLEHESGLRAEMLDYGATLRQLLVPVNGQMVSVCQGYETLEEYEAGTAYLGAVVGRCAGRIGGARFVMNGTEYHITANEGENHLHGGAKGFDRQVWDSEVLPDGVRFSRLSPDGEEGYPGDLLVQVDYVFGPDGVLKMRFAARAEGDTVVSLTHHGYWNLAGTDSDTVGGHLFSTPAKVFAAIGADSITTGELCSVEGRPFDFSSPRRLEDCWDQPDEQLAAGHGFDHTFLVEGQGLRSVCRLACPENGLTLEVHTTLPGIHLYTGNFLPVRRSAAALEAQFIPNAPNRPGFPQIWLNKGQTWEHQIQYRFTIEH